MSKIDDIKARWTTEYNILLSKDAKSCTSHHFACDCREYQRQEDIGELLREVEMLREERTKSAVWTNYHNQGIRLAAIEKAVEPIEDALNHYLAAFPAGNFLVEVKANDALNLIAAVKGEK